MVRGAYDPLATSWCGSGELNAPLTSLPFGAIPDDDDDRPRRVRVDTALGSRRAVARPPTEGGESSGGGAAGGIRAIDRPVGPTESSSFNVFPVPARPFCGERDRRTREEAQ